MFFNLLRKVPLNSLPYRTLAYSFTSSSNPTQVSLLDEVEGKVFQIIKQNSKCKTNLLTKTTKFSELGIDSLDSV